jgi:hypothetical protein
MAEIALSVLSMQCLERRIPDKAMLTEEVAAWRQSGIKGASDANRKRKGLHPSI